MLHVEDLMYMVYNINPNSHFDKHKNPGSISPVLNNSTYHPFSDSTCIGFRVALIMLHCIIRMSKVYNINRNPHYG